jgi:acetylcholinesterase
VRGLLPIAIQLRDCQLTIPQSLDLAWLPRVDGDFLTDDPQKLVQQGQVAKIPIVSGDCDDEGTLFSLAQTNVT